MTVEPEVVMNDRIRSGFVNAGFMGQIAHLRHYAAIEGASSSRSPSRARRPLRSSRTGSPLHVHGC